MPHRVLTRLAPAAALAFALGASAASAQVSPAESAKMLKPAKGLEATLWASEPMVHNPTNMDVDSRGRVWVTEGLNYRLTRGGNKRFSHAEDADRIKILEDTDGDGKADKVTVFADKIFPIPMGIAVEEKFGLDGKYLGARVYVGNSPNLMVFEDNDGDDKADKREALLTGFGGVDSDHGVHGMALGMDGKLYFTHGDGCCSVQPDKSEKLQNFDVHDKSGRHVSSVELGNALRVNRDGTQFEILADRLRNDYEATVDASGNVFVSDNDDDGNRGSRVCWIMDGGAYGYKTPGSPRHWGEDVPGNVPKLAGTGNGSPCGIMIYEGSLMPAPFRGALLEADAGTRQINSFPLTRRDSTFRTDAGVFLTSDDPWFRPVDMAAAPDGSVFVADWYDAGVGGHAFQDQTTGRIYRVVPEGSKPAAVTLDFAGIDGLIAALKSPAVASQDAARRSLVARGKEALPALKALFAGDSPVHRARALWAIHQIEGDAAPLAALKDGDPRIREQAVRMLGRDVSRNGKVEQAGPTRPLAAEVHLDALKPMADDPDAGVRLELILALRDLPTDKVGDTLKTLARSWDGRDRWYLEALGLALQKRESAFVSSLFDGSLYGALDLATAGRAADVALPPYFPVDRNEAYLGTRDELPAASPLSRTLGLSWRLRRPESLPLLVRVMPSLRSPEMQQAADDVLGQLTGDRAAVAVADLATQTNDPLRRRQLMDTLARRLDGPWRGARGTPEVTRLISRALNEPIPTVEAIRLAIATGDANYGDPLKAIAVDLSKSDELRVAAVEGIGKLKPSGPQQLLRNLVGDARRPDRSTAVAEAAVRVYPMVVEDARRALMDLIRSTANPLAIRREALRVYSSQPEGGQEILAMARAKTLPAELVTEATALVNAHADRRVRDAAPSVLPLPKAASGNPLPPIFELVRREGDAARGSKVFHREGANSCATCHRAQGRGNWVGPDLSTIGTKYGKAELIGSILNPSAAIGYNFRSLIVGMADGRTLTGLPVEDANGRLVLKTSDGRREVLSAADIDDRKVSEVSLMPEGLASTMSDGEFVDLIEFLMTLKQPVSIVGQFYAVGPLAPDEPFDTAAPIDVSSREGKHTWRRLGADAEGRFDLSSLADASQVAYLYAPVTSTSPQEARLVVDAPGEVKAWLGGKELALVASGDGPSRSANVTLPSEPTGLLLRLTGGAKAGIVATFVAKKPIEFSAEIARTAAP
ncbi:HEAT repeat domain-containing protein [Isosphaeraceae bacterium EP7]